MDVCVGQVRFGPTATYPRLDWPVIVAVPLTATVPLGTAAVSDMVCMDPWWSAPLRPFPRRVSTSRTGEMAT